MSKIRILVCGDRHFDDYDLLEKSINEVTEESGCEGKIVIAFVSAKTKGTRNTIAFAKKTHIRALEKKYVVTNNS